MSKAAIVCGLIYLATAVACATGGQNGDDKNDASVSGHHDASNVTTPDAPRVRLDGGTTTGADAQVSQLPPDAASQGPFCTANNQCTTAGECCVTLGGPSGFCAPGAVVLGQCVPQ